MNNVISHPRYDLYVRRFNINRKWRIFSRLHRRISNNKCPYCEQKLTKIQSHISEATIDHYRPKADTKYPSLKFDVNNYILMCTLCNRDYKNADFPLENGSVSACKPNEHLLAEEKPLLLHLIYDNPLEYFILVFTTHTSIGSILELRVKDGLSSYKNDQAETMLHTLGLGSPDNSKSVGDRIKQDRYAILRNHYSTFIDLATAIQDGDEDFETIIENNPNLLKYGFFNFIMNEDFIIQ